MKTKLIFAAIILISLKVQAQTTVLFAPLNNNVKDAWIWSYDLAENINFGEENASNNGLNNVIRSECWVWGTPNDTIRGLIDFDFSSIPTVTTIIEAKLSLFYFANSGFTQQTGQNDLLIQRINQNWSETGVVWTNQPSVSTANQITVSASTSSTQDYIDIDVTNMVQDMIDNPATSEGFMLKMLNEVPYKGLTFASSEHPDSLLHPTLEITYGTSVSVLSNNKAGHQVLIYPNPVKKEVFISLETGTTSLIKVQVFNVIGEKQIIGFNKNVLPGKHNLPLDISILNKGTYFVEIRSNEILITKTIIVE